MPEELVVRGKSLERRSFTEVLPLTFSFSWLLAECYTANGEDYRGFQNQTSLHGGKPCLFWNETFQHPYNTLKYPNGEGGLGSHNYCR
ncbi:Kremen protein 1 [Liparis tanakae]|uniref:Kremen protein 1 n=1 Tax=Liparis tanakae TaxID=230148 RepID=A0A4Z2EFL8_9TELE|nr:Kremen protein 1 [Liparis tanakae]